MRIAIDAMGGDHAPDEIVAGALAAARENPDIHLILVGQQDKLQPLMHGAPTNVEILHASEVVLADDEPVKAIRRKKDSSLVKAAQLVKEGQADGLVSAGNTGALMTAGLLLLGRIEGIERPALASVWPTFANQGLLVLDVGANMDASATHLVQYARMGHAYAKYVLGVDDPRVGLLNVGTEPGKGNQLTKEVFPLLEAESFNFVGNVEARDVMSGVCDVLVCDGFVGNAMLKFLEGVAVGMFGELKEVFTENTMSKMAALALKPGLKRFKKKLDYSEYGGAPLLGVDGACIKAHGSSKARAFQMAIHQAHQFLERGLLDEIRSGTRR